jgi:PAS domain S-box-containing protein
MKDIILKQYLNLLQSYLTDQQDIEMALHKANEIGRKALENGLGVLDMVEINQEVLYQTLCPQKNLEECWQIINATEMFFKESLASFEMTHRGYQEANTELRQLNQTLEQKVIERTQALHESEKKYRLLIETMNDGLCVVDENHLITFINQKICDMLGYSQQELLGSPITRYFDAVNQKIVTKQLTKQHQQGENPAYEIEWTRRDGHKVPTIFSPSTIFDAEGHFNGSFAVITDITERKQAEKALRKERASLALRVKERTAELSYANAGLARAARLKDEFLANMSHELRTPLNAVLALSEILEEQAFGQLNKKQLNYVQEITKSGHHLLNLINDILDLSKIEAGKLELQLGWIAVEDICQTSLSFIKQLASNKKLKIYTQFDGTITTIQADKLRLKQIMINLLNNAVKFTPEKQTIGLEVTADKEQEVVHFTVWDTGIGISKSDMRKLFQPFVQLDSGLARAYEGTGLGLALVRRLTEMHGGCVSLESEMGKGSRFTVSLPWQESGLSGTAVATVEPVKTITLRIDTGQPAPLILLAEDNESNIKSVSDYLQTKGYRVTVARNGAEAIDRAKEERPDVVLMDIQMPSMDGLAATRFFRAEADFKMVPIIALTALAMPGDKEECLAAGANEYLSKPVSLKNLAKLIEKKLSF